MRKAIRRGDLFYADLNPVVGSEQGGIRPVLVIQNDVGNHFSPTVVAAAITSRKAKNSLPTHILLENVPGLAPTSLLLLEQLRTIDRKRLRGYIGRISKEKMLEVDAALAISIGIEEPKVGVLSAVETVNPDIPSSVDAALLSKMAERKQITGGLVDGPLAMDNAVDIAAARTKGIFSPVAGRAEVLVVPDIDAGNMLAKQLTYISHAEAAGLVLGARVPIILNSRADDDMSRLASCAVAALHHARITGTG